MQQDRVVGLENSCCLHYNGLEQQIAEFVVSTYAYHSAIGAQETGEFRIFTRQDELSSIANHLHVKANNAQLRLPLTNIIREKTIDAMQYGFLY